jgi:hypothetical protein
VSQKAPSLPLTTRVVVLAQNKGSVGKSTLALCLLDLWIRNERKFQAIDGDSDHNTLTYAYEGEPWLKRIDLLGPEARRALLDFLCPEFQSPLALVDSPANCSTRFWASARRSLGYILSPESDIDINYKGFIEAWRTDQDKQLALAAKYLGLPYDLNVGALPQNSRLRRRK